MIHPHTELQFINSEVGHGVVATKFIPAGTITWVGDKLDLEFGMKEYQDMDPLYQDFLDIYTFRNKEGNYVLCWDNGRYVNHSFRSNCISTAYDFEVAIRDIEKGEQLTDDYGYLNVSTPFEAVDEGTKRKTVYPDDLTKYYKEWDKKVEKVFPKITGLDQPLRSIVPQATWNTIERIIAGEEEMKSILINYFDQERVGKPKNI